MTTEQQLLVCGARAAAIPATCGYPLGHAGPHGDWKLVDAVLTPAEKAARDRAFETRLDRHFAEFHRAHPEVYDKLHALALDLVYRGWTHLGIGMLWETMRYQTMLGAAPGEDDYRLNNNHRSRYARMLMEREPLLADAFETRALKG